MHQNSIHLFAIFKPPNCSISRGENEGRVTVASTASEYPLADFLNAEYRHVGYLLPLVLKSVRFGGFAPLYHRPASHEGKDMGGLVCDAHRRKKRGFPTRFHTVLSALGKA